MEKLNDLRRSLIPLEPDSTLIAVVEMSLSSWLVAGIVPGVERQPLKKLADETALLKLLHRWREEAEKAGHRIKRITIAFEAGRDGFWLARWLRTHDVEAYVIHPSSIAVSREHRRAKTDRLDTALLKRAFFGLASAQHANYPWCAYCGGGMDDGGGTNCGFTTFQQCLDTVRGIGGFCERNTQYVPPRGPHPWTRVRRRY